VLELVHADEVIEGDPRTCSRPDGYTLLAARSLARAQQAAKVPTIAVDRGGRARGDRPLDCSPEPS